MPKFVYGVTGGRAARGGRLLLGKIGGGGTRAWLRMLIEGRERLAARMRAQQNNKDWTDLFPVSGPTCLS